MTEAEIIITRQESEAIYTCPSCLLLARRVRQLLDHVEQLKRNDLDNPDCPDNVYVDSGAATASRVKIVGHTVQDGCVAFLGEDSRFYKASREGLDWFRTPAAVKYARKISKNKA